MATLSPTTTAVARALEQESPGGTVGGLELSSITTIYTEGQDRRNVLFSYDICHKLNKRQRCSNMIFFSCYLEILYKYVYKLLKSYKNITSYHIHVILILLVRWYSINYNISPLI